MMMLNELFNSDKVLQFWPTKKQSAKERVYATTRFILYLSCILYIIRRDVRILIMGTVLIFILYMMYKNGMIRGSTVTQNDADGMIPMKDNIMVNAGYGDEMNQTTQKINSKSAWDAIHPFQEGRWFAEHNFYTVPKNSGEDFLKNTYPVMFKPTCRDTDGSACDLESSQGRGPELVQSRAGGIRENINKFISTY
jgi:hypothetical protein